MKRQRQAIVGAYARCLGVETLESRALLTVASFSLEDVNPTSDTFGQMVSPDDFAGQTSAWYFSHST